MIFVVGVISCIAGLRVAFKLVMSGLVVCLCRVRMLFMGHNLIHSFVRVHFATIGLMFTFILRNSIAVRIYL